MQLAELYDTWLSDLDGTICHGNVPIPAAVSSVKRLAENPKNSIAYITNNAMKNTLSVVEKLQGYGLSLKLQDVISSATVAAAYAARNYPPSTRIFVVGSPALAEALAAVGFDQIGQTPYQLVVQCLYPDITWQDLATAASAIHEGADWLVTNTDLTLPSPQGLLPGNGSLVHAISLAVDPIKPVVVGKPEPEMIHTILAQFRRDYTRTIVIGDRIDTDICAANRAGVASLCVLTGANKLKDFLWAHKDFFPTYLSRDFLVEIDTGDISVSPKPGWSVKLRNNEMIISGPDSTAKLWLGVLHVIDFVRDLAHLLPHDLVITGSNVAGDGVAQLFIEKKMG